MERGTQPGASAEVPPTPQQREIAELLRATSDGDPQALDQLLPQVYVELRRMAHRQLEREQPGHTLDSLALVHEAYLKLVGRCGLHWESRAHFFAIAARVMRSILIDHARTRQRIKRGGGAVPLPLAAVPAVGPADRDEQLLALDLALTRLAGVNEEACRVVEYRYFAGLTLEEVAVVLGTSVATVRRRWGFAKAWLHHEMAESG